MPDTIRTRADMLAQITAQLSTGGGNTAAEVVQLLRDMLVTEAAVRPFPLSDHDNLIPVSQWIMPGWGWGSGATPNWTAGILAYIPIFCSRAIEFDRIGVEVVVGSAGSMRLGIYNAVHSSQNRLTIGSLLVDAGTINVGSSGSKTVTISQTLEGFYWLAVVGDSTPTIQAPDGAAAVHTPVQWANNDLNGTFDHCIPQVTGQSSLVSGGLPSTAVAPTSTATVARAIARMRMVA